MLYNNDLPRTFLRFKVHLCNEKKEDDAKVMAYIFCCTAPQSEFTYFEHFGSCLVNITQTHGHRK